MKQALFRQEAIEHQGERLKGELILSQPVSYSAITVFIAFITALALLYLWTNAYHRKQEVTGYLVPDSGLITVKAPRGGRLLSMNVKQDEAVEQNTQLFEVQVDQTITGEQFISEQTLENLHVQELKLIQQIELEKRNHGILRRQNDDNEQNAQLEIQQLDFLLENESNLLNLKSNALDRAGVLHRQGMISTADFDRVNSAMLEQRGAIQNIAFRINESKAALQNYQTEETIISLTGQRVINNLEAELARLQAQQIRTSADNINHILAPINAKVGSINIRPGQTVDARQEVISLIPSGSLLQAELYVPTRAVGFLRENQVVSIRYDAFPFQKFGVQKARITEISKTLVYPSEVSQSTAANEPVYRVIASLESQSVEAFGEDMSLRAGMMLRADVILEERSLFEWLLEPLFSIKGTL
jgi:membrane fusion protein